MLTDETTSVKVPKILTKKYPIIQTSHHSLKKWAARIGGAINLVLSGLGSNFQDGFHCSLGASLLRNMQEYHLLKVENEANSQTYHLNTSTIIIGRNTLSGISIDDENVMPHHVVLRRIPTTGLKHAFIMIAASGKVATLNQGKWFEAKQLHKTLVTGDVFQIGKTRFSYLIAYMTEAEYHEYFNAQPILVTSIEEEELAHF